MNSVDGLPGPAAACDVRGRVFYAAMSLVRGGRILQIGPRLEADPAENVEEGGGALLLPAFVEGHTHLDKTTWGSA